MTTQELLDLWVERGAKIPRYISGKGNGIAVEKASILKDNEPEDELIEIVFKHFKSISLHVVSITDILFSPDSNFFEVMFGDAQLHFVAKGYSIEDESTYGVFKDAYTDNGLYYGLPTFVYHKMMAVISKDPVQYIIEQLKK